MDTIVEEKPKRHMLLTDDDKCNYMCGLEPEPIGNAGLVADNKEYIDINKVDYMLNTNITITNTEPEPENLEYMEHNNKVEMENKQKTLSYLSVKSVEEGIEWYRKEFPKIPDELLPLMSRWNFGDLQDETKS